MAQSETDGKVDTDIEIKFDQESGHNHSGAENEDYLSKEKDNKTTKQEYYLRENVSITNIANTNKIVEDGLTNLTHPFDNRNWFIKWFDRITYDKLIFLDTFSVYNTLY